MARKRPRRAIPADKSRPAVSVSGGAAALAAMVQADIEKLSAMRPTRSMTTMTQRQNQVKRCVATLKLLGELTGESKAMPESKVVKLPAFRRVVAEIVKVLEKWPEALVAVGETLARLERGEAAEGAGP